MYDLRKVPKACFGTELPPEPQWEFERLLTVRQASPVLPLRAAEPQ